MNRGMRISVQVLCVVTMLFTAGLTRTAFAQVTPAAGFTPPDDTPSIRIGTTIFPNFTYQTDPKITDTDGNLVHRSAFDVSRAYLNVTGNISHIVAFRVTPDIARETNTASSLSGSLVFRIKYAYLQTNFDDWMTRGSYARFGIQQTPYLDYEEGIYRYRFQGTMFLERAGYMSSADAGVSFHYQFKANYGDVHVGLFNGENYNRAEVNDQKAIMIRAAARPFARQAPILRGLRAAIFFSGDNYVKNGERKRTMATATYEHPRVTAGFEYLDVRDQRSALPGIASVKGNGYSFWIIPRDRHGWEGLIRYDHLTPNTSGDLAPLATSGNATTALEAQKQNRVIVGVAYWFPRQGNVSSALLVDYDGQIFKGLSAAPTKVVAVHGLINF